MFTIFNGDDILFTKNNVTQYNTQG